MSKQLSLAQRPRLPTATAAGAAVGGRRGLAERCCCCCCCLILLGVGDAARFAGVPLLLLLPLSGVAALRGDARLLFAAAVALPAGLPATDLPPITGLLLRVLLVVLEPPLGLRMPASFSAPASGALPPPNSGELLARLRRALGWPPGRAAPLFAEDEAAAAPEAPDDDDAPAPDGCSMAAICLRTLPPPAGRDGAADAPVI